MIAKKTTLLKLIPVLFITILLSGCWDYISIEERGYIIGLSIDKVSPNKIEEPMNTMTTESSYPMYTYGIQLPILARAQSKPVGQASGGTTSEKTWNLKFNGNSLFEVNREFSTRLDYRPHYPHLQSIIISEAVAREGITKPLDFLLREPAIRRHTLIYITESTAFDVFNISPYIDDFSSVYLQNITQTSSGRTSRMVHRTDLGQVSKYLHNERCFVLSKIIFNDSEIKNSGGAVFKDAKLIGYIDELTQGYRKFITNLAKGGSIVVNTSDNNLIALEILKFKTKVTPIVSGDKISFKLNCKTTVNLAEQMSPSISSPLSTSSIKTIEADTKKHIEKQLLKTINSVQDDFGVDIFLFYDALQKKYPKTWDQVKDDWDNTIFRNVSVDVNADVTVQLIGNIN